MKQNGQEFDNSLAFCKDMAFPARPVFTPFVVVVGGKYFLPVPECLLFDRNKCSS